MRVSVHVHVHTYMHMCKPCPIVPPLLLRSIGVPWTCVYVHAYVCADDGHAGEVLVIMPPLYGPIEAVEDGGVVRVGLRKVRDSSRR